MIFFLYVLFFLIYITFPHAGAIILGASVTFFIIVFLLIRGYRT